VSWGFFEFAFVHVFSFSFFFIVHAISKHGATAADAPCHWNDDGVVVDGFFFERCCFGVLAFVCFGFCTWTPVVNSQRTFACKVVVGMRFFMFFFPLEFCLLFSVFVDG
jgi:hypothetical protein